MILETGKLRLTKTQQNGVGHPTLWAPSALNSIELDPSVGPHCTLSNNGVHTILVTVPDACAMLSCKKTKLFDLLRTNQLERRKIGRSTRITVSSIFKLAGLNS